MLGLVIFDPAGMFVLKAPYSYYAPLLDTAQRVATRLKCQVSVLWWGEGQPIELAYAEAFYRLEHEVCHNCGKYGSRHPSRQYDTECCCGDFRPKETRMWPCSLCDETLVPEPCMACTSCEQMVSLQESRDSDDERERAGRTLADTSGPTMDEAGEREAFPAAISQVHVVSPYRRG